MVETLLTVCGDSAHRRFRNDVLYKSRELRFLKGAIVKTKIIYILIIALFIITFVSVKPGNCQNGYSILVQESPVGAGRINPGMGVQSFDANKMVNLNAIANPGWQFVYWLGNVSDPTRNNTTVAVDGPKIVIAVFERVAFEFTANSGSPSLGPEISTPQYYSTGGGTGGGAFKPDDGPDPRPRPGPEPEPIPEPATIVLLVGGVLVLYNRTKKYKRREK